MFNNNVIYGEHGRSIVVYQTKDMEELYELISKGFSYYSSNDGFWLKAPEQWLVDITEPRKVLYYGNPVINLAYYNFLSDLINTNRINNFIESVILDKIYTYRGLKFDISCGPAMEGEIRIIGSDNRIIKLKNNVFDRFYYDIHFTKYFNDAKDYLEKIRELKIEYRPIESENPKIRYFFNQVSKYYSPIYNGSVYNENIIKTQIDNYIEFDILLFIPSSCFGYLADFVTERNVDKIMFWEIHAHSSKQQNNRLFLKNMKGKKVLIIDKTYTGKTMDIMSEMIKNEGGIPIKVALYPKNKHVLNKCEYFIFLDRFFKSEEIKFNSNDFLKNIYKKVLKGDNIENTRD